MTSAAQTAQRNIIKAVYPRWSTDLTDAQRDAWRTFTEGYRRKDVLGQSYAPSGQNRHVGCNAISYKYGGVWLDDPPPDLHCHQPTLVEILTATAAPQALTIRMYGTLDADEYWVLSATPLLNPGVYKFDHLWRPLHFGDDVLPYTYDAIAAYTADFSALVAGKKLHAKLQIANVATGTISRPIQATAIIA